MLNHKKKLKQMKYSKMIFDSLMWKDEQNIIFYRNFLHQKWWHQMKSLEIVGMNYKKKGEM